MLQSVLICTYFMISAMYPIIESAISNGLVSSTLKKAVYVTAERRNVTDNPLHTLLLYVKTILNC